MKSRLVIILLFIGVLLISSCSKFRVYHLNSLYDEKVDNGLIYNIPQTGLLVEVDVEKSIKIKGPYAEHADKYLGLKNVIAYNQTSYEIKNIRVRSMQLPDTSQYYLIKTKKINNIFKKRKINSFSLGNNLNLVSINNRSDAPERFEKEEFEINTKNQSYPNLFKLYADASQVEQIDTVYETYKLDTIVMSKPVIKRTLITKTPEQRAEEAADYILKFRLKRFELLSAYQEVPYSKEAFEFLTKELEKTENQYLELFTGISLSEVSKYQFLVVPNLENKNKSVNLFGFSTTRGVCDANDIQSETYSIQFESMAPSATIDSLTSNHIKSTSKKGIYYRIPEETKIYFMVNGEVIQQYYFEKISQFGFVHYLPTSAYRIIFDQNSSSIRKVQVK
ncbi:MAG: DUF4831 family protein [Bacteroidales bacterium]|nr:DUF4831 family protein [Bacteroidales bacterium]